MGSAQLRQSSVQRANYFGVFAPKVCLSKPAMDRIFSILFLVLNIITFLEYADAAVVVYHSDLARESIQRTGGSIRQPPFFFLRRGTELNDEENHGSSLMQQLGYRSEPQEEDNEPQSFMMISTSTFSGDDMLGSGPFGEQADSPGVVSIDMTIIQFDDSTATESRKVARRFGSSGPLSIGRSYSSYSAAASSDSSNRPASEPHIQNTQADKLAEIQDSDPFQSLWKLMNDRNTQVPLSIPTGGSHPEKAEKLQHSYPKSPSVTKKDIPQPLTTNAKEKIIMKPSPVFDYTSHHSQL